MQRIIQLILAASVSFAVACSSPPSAPPASSVPTAASKPAEAAKPAAPATTAAAPAAQPASTRPAEAAKPAKAAKPAAGADTLDPELKNIYDEAVKVIPGLTPEILAGAKKEAALSLYHNSYDFVPVFAAFKKVFPFVTITDFDALGVALIQRYGTEARANRAVADVVMAGDPTLYADLIKDNLLMNYEITSAKFFDNGDAPKGLYYPTNLVQLCAAYNTTVVSEADAAGLSTWEGILDPKFKEKSALARYGSGSVGLVPYYWITKEKGNDFWDKLVAQKPLVFTSVPVMTERLAAGTISLIPFANDGNLFTLYKKGAPIQWSCPEPGLVIPSYEFIASNAPHPYTAKLWVEWMSSQEGQRTYMQSTGLRAARTDVPDERAFVKEPWYKVPTKLFSFSWAQMVDAKPTLQTLWETSAPQMGDGGG